MKLSVRARFPADVRAAYVEAICALGHAHAICEEYRASATIGRKHDLLDIAEGRCIDRRLWCCGAHEDL